MDLRGEQQLLWISHDGLKRNFEATKDHDRRYLGGDMDVNVSLVFNCYCPTSEDALCHAASIYIDALDFGAVNLIEGPDKLDLCVFEETPRQSSEKA